MIRVVPTQTTGTVKVTSAGNNINVKTSNPKSDNLVQSVVNEAYYYYGLAKQSAEAAEYYYELMKNSQVQSDWEETDINEKSYIKNKPTIPTVGNGTVTIIQNGSQKGTFSLNQSGNTEVTLDCGITSVDWGDIGGSLANQTDLQTALDVKQDILSFDLLPQLESDNPVKSGGIYSSLAAKQDLLTSDNAGTDISIVQGTGDNETLDGNESLDLVNAKANGLNSVTLSGACELRELPSEYQRVEFLQGGNGTYIDTGIVPTSNVLHVKWKGQLLGSAYGGSFYGCSTSTTPRAGFRFFSNANNGNFTIQSGSTIEETGVGFNPVTVDITYDNVNQTIDGQINSSIISQTGTNLNLNFNKNMLLFTAYIGDNVGSSGEQKCWGLLVEKDGVLVQNLVPCRRLSDSVLGMYDTVTGNFLTNAGTGTFVAGTTIYNIPSEYTQLNYLRSNGGYIDTRYIPTVNSSIEYNVAFASVTANNCLFGTRTSGSYSSSTDQFYGGAYVANSNKIYWYSGKTRTNTDIVPENGVYYNITCTNENMTGTAEYPMALFALNNAGTVATSTVMDLAYFKIYESNVLVRNLLPVKRNSDNALGVYDTVTNTFFAGTGDFIAGDEITPTPTPTKPINIYCNNGAVKVRLKSDYDPAYNVLTGIRCKEAGAWFGTGINVDINTELEVEASNITSTSTQLVVANSPATTFFRIVKAGSSQKIVGSINSTSVTSNTDGTARFTAKLNKTGFYIDGTLVGSIGATSISGMGEIEVCHAVYGGTQYSGTSTTFHRVTIRQNGTDVFNGVPRQRISDGKIGMLDTVSNTFFSSDGIKEFYSTGLDPNAYELYVDGTTETVKDSLDNTATAERLLGVGTYADIQEVLSGAITRNVGVKVLDGTETITLVESSGVPLGYYFAVESSDISHVAGTSGGMVPAYCTHFTNVINTGFTLVNGTFTLAIATNKLYIGYSGVSTAEEFSTWLMQQYQAGTPVILVYPLATATTETVTGQTLTTQKGTNTIEITQASIDGLGLEASYDTLGDVIISFSNNTGYITSSALSGYAFNSDIPTNISDLTNDSGYITSSALSGYVQTSDLAAVATTGAYSDLSGTPFLAAVATSGDYADLNNTPNIPTVGNGTITIYQGSTQKGTFTVNQSSNTSIYLDSGGGGGSSRNIGEIVTSTIPLDDAGLHLLDGTLLQGSGSYSDFVTYIAGLRTNYSSLFTTESAWQSSVSNYGVCGKFVYNSTNNTVRLPKITGFIEGTDTVSNLGDLLQAGLPNITGRIGDNSSGGNTAFYINQTVSGAFSITASSSDRPSYGTGNTAGYITLDASRSSSVYGNSTTVQPQAVKVYYYIVVAISTKTSIEVDIDDIATDLNGKADTDLSNVPASKGILTESYVSGSSWYRVYSDGWCEQGNFSGSLTSNSSVALLKNYKDTNYGVVIMRNYVTTTSTTTGGDWWVREKTTSSFKPYTNQLSAPPYTCNWKAYGYIR